MPYSIAPTDNLCYPGTTVLINKPGLRSQAALDEAESAFTALHTLEIETEPCTEPFTFSFYCRLHYRLFCDLYDWAGTPRTIDIAKKGTQFYPAENLITMSEAKFRYLQDMHEFRNIPRSRFIRELVDFYHELNMLHPFRDGNGRTQRLFFTLLIRRAGYDISFADSDADLLMMATIFAAQGVKDHLRQFFEEAVI